MDVVCGLRNWSYRSLRWLIDYIARQNDKRGQPTYTAVQAAAWDVADKREPSWQTFPDEHDPAGHFILAGIEGHEFARCKSVTDCYQLASRMGLGIVPRLDGYLGHAIIHEVGL